MQYQGMLLTYKGLQQWVFQYCNLNPSMSTRKLFFLKGQGNQSANTISKQGTASLGSLVDTITPRTEPLLHQLVF